MAVYVASARIDENGKAHGGKAGDQNGKEVSRQAWYDYEDKNPGVPWVLLRCVDDDKRLKIAQAMTDAYLCDFIGYDQYQRDTLYEAVKNNNFDVNTLTSNVETDCSALVRVCVCFAGIACPNFTTTNEAAVLLITGFFVKYTDTAHTKSPDRLLAGDILVSAKQGHTVVVLNDGQYAAGETAAGVLARGMKNSEAVRTMQKNLIAAGYSVGKYGADGDFGEDTEKALLAFQTEKGLKVTGTYTEETREKLTALAAVPSITPEESGALTVIGGTWNLRTGPGTGYPVAEIVKGGERLAPVELGSWQPILRNGQTLYISKNAVKGDTNI